MECPKCSSIMIGDKDGYCARCGYMSNGEFIDVTKISETDNYKELTRLFIGNNADRFFGISNWSAFIFGSLYLLYRKCYLIGFCALFIESIILFLALKFAPLSLPLIFIFKIIISYCFSEKKGYMIGYALLVINIFLLLFLVNIVGMILIIFFVGEAFLYFAFTNAIYLENVKRKIGKIDNKNISLIKKVGGTSFIYPIIAIGIIFIVFLIYIFITRGI